MDTATRIETVSETSKDFDAKTAKGLLLQYGLYLEKEGYGLDCRYKGCIRMLINSGANLLDPESVKEVIAKKERLERRNKDASCYAYDAMTKMLKLTWTMPKYRQEEAFPFIPEERELDDLIAGAGSQRMSIYLQTLKETMADPSEALRLRWIDINGNVIMINRPVKGHYPRPIEVSHSLISTLNQLPKNFREHLPHNICEHRKMLLQNKAETGEETQQSPAAFDQSSDVQTLGSYNGLLSNKQDPAGQEVAGTQEHQFHDEIHSTGRLQR